MTRLLEINNLKVSYQGEGPVLKGLDFDIYEREVLCIVGESGSGKSTLIKSLMNLLPKTASIDAGTVRFESEALDFKDKELWRMCRGKLFSMIFQNPAAYFNPILKIRKQFIRTLRAHLDISKDEALAKSRETLEKMGFDNPERILSSYVYQLSGGMVQRVAIALAMVLEPKILFADEPTSALDVLNQEQIMDELLRLRDAFGTTLVIVTHNMGCASYMSDRIMIMREGIIEELGCPDQVLHAPKTEYAKTLIGAVPKLKGVVI